MERPAQAPTQLPPGFRFHPTDEELVLLYLRRKALARPLPAAVIPVVHDVAGLDPWDLPGACPRMLPRFELLCFQLRQNREHFQIIHAEFFCLFGVCRSKRRGGLLL